MSLGVSVSSAATRRANGLARAARVEAPVAVRATPVRKREARRVGLADAPSAGSVCSTCHAPSDALGRNN